MTRIFARAYLRVTDPENNCARIIDIVLRALYIWNKLLRVLLDNVPQFL